MTPHTERRRSVWLILLGAALAVGVAILGGFIVMITGAINPAASRGPGAIESTIAEFALHRAIARRAPDKTNPLPVSPEVLKDGLSHYAANCVVCHAAPGAS